MQYFKINKVTVYNFSKMVLNFSTARFATINVNVFSRLKDFYDQIKL